MRKKNNPLEPFRLTSGTSSTLNWLGEQGAFSSCIDYELSGSKLTRKTVSGNISRLKKDDFIQKEGKRVSFTEKGRLVYLKLKIKKCGLLPENEVCLVVFDIPEKERRVRKFLRDFLGSVGFFPIQKSVWLSMFNATKELNEYFRAVDLGDKVLAVTAKKE